MGTVGCKMPLSIERQSQALNQSCNCLGDGAQLIGLTRNIERRKVLTATLRNSTTKILHGPQSAAHRQPYYKNVEWDKPHQRPQHGFGAVTHGVPTFTRGFGYSDS